MVSFVSLSGFNFTFSTVLESKSNFFPLLSHSRNKTTLTLPGNVLFNHWYWDKIFLNSQFSGIVSKCFIQTEGRFSCCEDVEDTSFFLPPPNILLKKAMIKIVWRPQTMHYLVWKNLQHFTLVTVTWSPCCVTHQFSSLPASWHRWVKYCCNRLFTFVGHFPKYCLLAAQILLLSTGCSGHTAAVHMYSKIVHIR